jgi:hypothetical protein
MKKEIKFSLVYRDMWQSSGKYQPRADQLVRIAPLIIEMGCFSRVETNGGAFEQVNLLYGENPNKAVRAFTKPFHEASIQTHMLDRGLNGLRMYPVPADVRRLMYKVKHAQGVDITRIFCGLNEVRNIIPSIHYALEAGMIPQATLCITFSPVHTVEYYTAIAERLIEAGAPEICLKDMAGVGRPEMLGRLTKAIKERHPEIIIQYHGHSGPGLSMASILEVCENGADIIDVAMEPISWGKVHPDVISVQAMLKDAGFQVPEINMKAYMKARAMTQEFIDDFLGYFMDPTNKHMSSLLLKCGLPGGMMGSMMADLKGVHSGINLILRGKNEPELSIDDLLVMLFDEVRLRNNRENAFADIDVQLKQRHDLIPQLVDTVKGYAAHEKDTLERVIQARNGAVSAKTIDEKIAAENQLSSALSGLKITLEAYPDLKANQNFLQLQEEVSDVENKLAAVRRYFNSATKEYNNAVQTFPSNIIAGMAGFRREIMFDLGTNERANLEQAPKISF